MDWLVHSVKLSRWRRLSSIIMLATRSVMRMASRGSGDW